jgi:hypothetical protein
MPTLSIATGALVDDVGTRIREYKGHVHIPDLRERVARLPQYAA